jgi:hypothetical protein
MATFEIKDKNASATQYTAMQLQGLFGSISPQF